MSCMSYPVLVKSTPEVAVNTVQTKTWPVCLFFHLFVLHSLSAELHIHLMLW